MTSTETEEKLRKLASVNPELADKAWMFYIASDEQERRMTEGLLDVILFQETRKGYEEKIFLKAPPADQCVGQYQLGTVLSPPNKVHSAFGLREDEWIRHVMITGMTGIGKTNLTFSILRELRKKNKPFLVFDWKRSYRDLIQLPDFKDTKVFTVGRDVTPFTFNPLYPPPGVPPGIWMARLVDVIYHAYFGGQGVEFLLRNAIDKVYEDCGVFDGTYNKAPTFHRVLEELNSMPARGRKMLWKASAERALESLCFSRVSISRIQSHHHMGWFA